MQFNDNGTFGADTGIYTYDPAATLLKVFGGGTTYKVNAHGINGNNDLTVSGNYTGSNALIDIIAPAGDTELIYSNLTGSIGNGTTVTGDTSGATGTIDYDNGTDTVWLSNVSGSFQNGEGITTDNGDTATLVSSAVSSTDTFSYSENLGPRGALDMTGSAQSLPNGLVVTFASTTGHVTGEWSIGIGSRKPVIGSVLTNAFKLSNGSSTLSLNPVASGGTDYSLVFPGNQGTAGQTLINDGSGNLTWGSAGGSPAGSSLDAQFNNGGVFGADTGIYTYDPASTLLKVFKSGATTYSIVPYKVNGPDDLSVSGGYTGTTAVLNIVGQVGDTKILYTSRSSSSGGETVVTGDISGATGTVDYDNQTDTVWITNVSGTFQDGEGITFDNGDRATLTTSTITAGDIFSYSEDLGPADALEMTGGAQSLPNGLVVQFATTTGHKNGQWTITKTGTTPVLGSIETNTFKLSNGTDTLSLVAPVAGGGNYSLVFPTGQGSAGKTLINDGSGNLTWGSAGGSPAGSSLDAQFNNGGVFGADTGVYTYDPASTLLKVLSGGLSTYSVTPRDLVGNNDLTVSGGYSGGTVSINVISQAGITKISYNSLSGFLNNGTTVTGNNSGATGTIVYDNRTDIVWLSNVSGTFQDGEGITDNVGDTATIASSSITTGDLFNYREGNGPTNYLEMTGLPQLLPNGLVIQFGSPTGHARGNWRISVTSTSPTAGSIETNTFKLSNGTDTLSLVAPVAGGGNYSLVFPTGQGSAGQSLINDGSGNLTWGSASGGLIGSTNGVTVGGSAGSTSETWLGYLAGANSNSNSKTGTVFVGNYAGSYGNDLAYDTFIGNGAGSSTSTISNSFFAGESSGDGASTVSGSIFIGNHSGKSVNGAAHSIFIGEAAGSYDTLSNYSSGGTSILIGDYTSTGGFSNSIVLGAHATNTATNQFYLADNITNFNLAGVNYNFPTVQAGAQNEVLVNNGSGTLTWSTQVVQMGVTGDTIYTPDLGAGQGATLNPPSLNGKNIFLGVNTGSGAINAHQSVFIGYNAGVNDTTGESGTFVGANAGYNATNITGGETFIGSGAGFLAAYASGSQFFGTNSGDQATNAYSSTFLGINTGYKATNAANSIFIGLDAGSGDTVDNVTIDGRYSILIGDHTSTGGNSDSIALGAFAQNTLQNQFVVGSNTGSISQQVPINQMVIEGSGGQSCTLNTSGGAPSCTSDQRLKTNITDLSTNALATLTKVRTVTFNWIAGSDTTNQYIGFLAQDLQQYYPQLVSTAPNGYLQVNYAGITPVLVESIRELNLKLTNIEAVAATTDQTFITNLISWLGDSLNKLTAIHVDKQICIGQTCITESDLQQFKTWEASQGTTSSGSSSPSISSGTGGSSPSTATGDTTASPTTDPSVSSTPVTDPSTTGTPVVDPSTTTTPASDPSTSSTPSVTPPSDPSSSTPSTSASDPSASSAPSAPASDPSASASTGQ